MGENYMNITQSVQENLKDYAGEVIQRRALVSVYDGLKPSARQIFYALHTDKMTHKKHRISTMKAVGSGMRFYTHGDTSLIGILMRAGQPFNTRYPLADIEGAYGTLTESGNWAAPRYTKIRLSEIASHMFTSIEKNTIDKWYNNYDDTEKYPAILPCLGYWPLINGSMGIGVGLASSIPSFNLREMNTALINLLWNKEFDLPMPDFCGGGTLINAKEVRESLLEGNGKAAKIRAKIDYDAKKHTLTVTEIPPLTYTNKICAELEAMMEDDCGYDRFLDTSSDAPSIIIWLKKSAQPDLVISRLYKETSLQNTYSINMTMLDGGTPKVFSLPEAMQKHLEHEIECYKKSFQYDLDKIQARLHIVRGYINACASIEEVISTIKASASKSEASKNLQRDFTLTAIQAEAVLKLTLSRLASMEVQKFIDERNELIAEVVRIEEILRNPDLVKKEVEKGLRTVMTKFSDTRRTRVLDLVNEDNTRVLYFTATGKAYLNKPKKEAVVATVTTGMPYIGITKNGIAMRSNDVPKSAKNIFKVAADDTLMAVYPATDLDYLIVYSRDKKFRCTQIKQLNKGKTTLSLSDLTQVLVSPEKMTKAEFTKK